MKILILCTGNSCRSQMSHGFMKSFDQNLQVFSAGTQPVDKINDKAVEVMNEIGIDISNHKPAHVNKYTDQVWDYVITVCGGAKETCPVFIGDVKKRLHIGFDDPSETTGSEEFIMSEFRRVRDLIKIEFQKFYQEEIKTSI